MLGASVVVMSEGKVKWNDGKSTGSAWDWLAAKASGITTKRSL